jgi:hypothetical protein
VQFASGSSKVSANYEEELKKLAQTATSLTGYIIEVTGYADATGSAAMNTKLSEDRAKAVINYPMQQGGVPVRHIVAPGAMGIRSGSDERDDGWPGREPSGGGQSPGEQGDCWQLRETVSALDS